MTNPPQIPVSAASSDPAAPEPRIIQRTRVAQSVKVRYGVGLVAVLVALLAVHAGGGAHWAAVAFAAAPALLNVPVHLALRARRARMWHYWLLLVGDAVSIAGSIAFTGRFGYVGLGFYLVVGMAHGFGLHRAGLLSHALAVVLYPAARLYGGAGVDPWGLVAETVALALLGWLSIQAPARFTARVRRARRAIGAMERGNFSVRLPAHTIDDLGYLAVSLNRTAESLEEARRDAQAVAARMHAVARAAAGVIAADSPTALHDVLHEAAGQVIGFDTFTFGVYFAETHTIEYFDAPLADAPSRPVLVAGLPSEQAIRERRSIVTLRARGWSADATAAVVGDDGRHAHSIVRTPILAGDDVLGVISVLSHAPEAYGPADVEVLEAVAALAGTALRNIQLVGELRRSREALAHQAYHDSLTGLANRSRFRTRLASALAKAPSRVAVLALDLDGFKRVNDSFGHAAGDTLLRHVADRLLNATRGCDTVARLGGDEFAVLLANVRTVAEAEIVAERIVRSLDHPFVIDDAAVTIGSSVGLAWAGAMVPEGETVEPDGPQLDGILRDADLALYEAKVRGKGRFVVWEPAMHEAAVRRLELEADLRAGLARGELRLHYQPIVALEGGEMIGAEALVRWMHPRRGIVAPADFIPVAEDTGLIAQIGGWVLAEACRQVVDWQRRGLAASVFSITVNVSGKQLARASFVSEVGRVLRASGLDPACLVLELTESSIVENSEGMLDRLHALKRLGVRLAVDDFGTGHSALGYLRHFPIDVLKIDRTFVDGVARGGAGAALARAIVALADAMELRTVAEGIEDTAQRESLLSMGCRLGQGYHFARPLDADALEAMLPPLSTPAFTPIVPVPPPLTLVRG